MKDGSVTTVDLATPMGKQAFDLLTQSNPGILPTSPTPNLFTTAGGVKSAAIGGPNVVTYVKTNFGKVSHTGGKQMFLSQNSDQILLQADAPSPFSTATIEDAPDQTPVIAAGNAGGVATGGTGSTGTPFDTPYNVPGTGLLCVFENKIFSGTAPAPRPIPDKTELSDLKAAADTDRNDEQADQFVNAHQRAQIFEDNKIPKNIREQFGSTPPGPGQGATGEFNNNGGGNNGPGGPGGGGGQPPGGNPSGMSQMMQQLLPALMQMIAMAAMQDQGNQRGNAQLGEACTKPEQCKSGLCMISNDATGQDTGVRGYCTIVCPALAEEVARAERNAPSQPSQPSQNPQQGGFGYPQPPLGFNQQYPYGYPYAYNQYPYGGGNQYPFGGGFNQPLVPIIRSAEKLAELFFQTATPSVSASATPVASPLASPTASPGRFTQAQRNQRTLADAISGCPRLNGKLTICCTDCGEKPACTIA